MPGEPKRRNTRWRNRSEEDRLRCRAMEKRNGTWVQCSENRKEPHEHQSRGKPFGADFSMPVPGGPSLDPSRVKL